MINEGKREIFPGWKKILPQWGLENDFSGLTLLPYDELHKILF